MKTLTRIQKNRLANQRNFALRLMGWHGGQSSALYAVGSCMLADAERGEIYDPLNHRGHHPANSEHDLGALSRAVAELSRDSRDEEYRSSQRAELARLSKRLASLI